MKHYLIYVPGLGDRKIRGQRMLVNYWPIWGVKSEVYHMKWFDGEAFKPKMDRLGKRIKELKKDGYAVSLVGTSAGGSAVVNAFALFKDDLHGMVSIAGAIHGKDIIHPYTFRSNPAFKESMFMSDASLASLNDEDKTRLFTARPIVDVVVYPRNTKIQGVKSRVVPAFGHFFGIAFGISFYTPIFVRFLKKLPAKV